MNPTDALQHQIEHYRQMTGEQRLTLALRLHELSCDVAREGIRHQHPEANAEEVERLLRQRLELAHLSDDFLGGTSQPKKTYAGSSQLHE